MILHIIIAQRILHIHERKSGRQQNNGKSLCSTGKAIGKNIHKCPSYLFYNLTSLLGISIFVFSFVPGSELKGIPIFYCFVCFALF